MCCQGKMLLLLQGTAHFQRPLAPDLFIFLRACVAEHRIDFVFIKWADHGYVAIGCFLGHLQSLAAHITQHAGLKQ